MAMAIMVQTQRMCSPGPSLELFTLMIAGGHAWRRSTLPGCWHFALWPSLLWLQCLQSTLLLMDGASSYTTLSKQHSSLLITIPRKMYGVKFKENLCSQLSDLCFFVYLTDGRSCLSPCILGYVGR
jgi:hypothetical protein